MKIILWFFDSIQFVGAIVEYYPFTLWIHPICSGYWLALQTPTEWSGLEGNKLALPMQNSGTGGVHLQDGRTQGQNFAQNGSQKPFCNGPEASDLVTKISTGIVISYNMYLTWICLSLRWFLMSTSALHSHRNRCIFSSPVLCFSWLSSWALGPDFLHATPKADKYSINIDII